MFIMKIGNVVFFRKNLSLFSNIISIKLFSEVLFLFSIAQLFQKLVLLLQRLVLLLQRLVLSFFTLVLAYLKIQVHLSTISVYNY